MLKRYYLALTLLLCSFAHQALSIDVRHAQPREGSVLDQYAVDLIKFLLERSGKTVNLIPYQAPESQTRKEFQLNAGNYDIDWFGSTADIERRVTPIRFPIFRGLLGHRVFITNKNTSEKLYKNMPVAELQALNVIQGQGWGDISVLRDGGYNNIKTITKFENIFKMIEHNRSDLFPRSITEPYGELSNRCKLSDNDQCLDKNLLVDDKLLIVYKLPMFLFVSPKRKDLIELLTQTFENDYDAFLDFFNQHPLIESSLRKIQNRTTYTISNNQSLSTETNHIAEKYWINN